MKTNFQMIQELKDFYPEHRGIVSAEEMRLIAKTFEVGSRVETDLRNLRDFVVMFYTMHAEEKSPEEFFKDNDKMSAICSVIDRELLNGGWEL